MLLRRPFVLAAAAALASAAGGAAAAQQAQTPPEPEIVTSASAEQPVAANLATVSVSFSRDGRDPAEGGRRVALAADSLRAALAGLGIARDSVINRSRWYWWDDRIRQVPVEGRHEIVADTTGNGHFINTHEVVHWDTVYRVTESLTIRMHDLSRVGRVIDVLLAHGIRQISNVDFAATGTEEAQRAAIRQATERARQQAEVIAAAGGGRLGRTLRLSTDAEVGEPRYSFRAISLQAASDAVPRAETVVVAPVLHVSATVYGRWQFIEGR